MKPPATLGVVICTHQPDVGRLNRVLSALSAQTLSPAEWGLVVVDNASSPPLAVSSLHWDWHPRARLVREETLGLVWARRRGLAESGADVLVFVDDDNVLAPGYLAAAREIASDWPGLGVWGGEITGEFERPPAPELAPYLGLLALLPVPCDVWCNYRTARCLPRGAGLVVRRSVAENYFRKLDSDPLRQALGRHGASLASCEDSDLCFTAVELGLGLGLFRQLALTHLIPAPRLQLPYLLRLQEAMSYSWTLLNYLHAGAGSLPQRDWPQRLADYFRQLAQPALARKFTRAGRAGQQRAGRFLRQLARSP